MFCPVSWGHSVPFLQLISADFSHPSSKLHQTSSGNRGATLGIWLFGQEHGLTQESWTWNRNPGAPVHLEWGTCSFSSCHWFMDHGWMGTPDASAQPGHAQWFPHLKDGGDTHGQPREAAKQPLTSRRDCRAQDSWEEQNQVLSLQALPWISNQPSEEVIAEGGEQIKSGCKCLVIIVRFLKCNLCNLCFLWKLMESRTKWLNYKITMAGCS